MLKMSGKFGYYKNCTILHHLPNGVVCDGYPVIVFPGQGQRPLEGVMYSFMPAMAKNGATYVIDGKTFKVAHAGLLERLDSQEADWMDSILKRNSGDAAGGTLADRFGSDFADKLKSAVKK